MMSYQDRVLTCRDCGRSFIFSREDQRRYIQKGYLEPKRCPACRQARRTDWVLGRGSYSPRGRQVFPAICAQCGKDTLLPFEPHRDQPIYCSECYRRRRATSG
ncbi:MAG: zinc-ribbon domain containing protein [Chloroflexi bacterium]|nr:zinc-ribbon domain containing protein [Chloroflexota bacterium]